MPYERCEMSKDEFEIDKMLDFERAILSFQIPKPTVRCSVSVGKEYPYQLFAFGRMNLELFWNMFIFH